MKSLINNTNGVMVLSGSFTTDLFKESLHQLFQKNEQENVKMEFNATLEVQTTSELKVCGLIGHTVSINKKSSCVSETTEIG